MNTTLSSHHSHRENDRVARRGWMCGTYTSDLWREAAAGLEWLELRCSPVYAGAGVPRGDRSPIIVVPGLFAADASLVELRAWLARIGYAPHRSGIELNARCPRELVKIVVQTVDRVYASSGCRVTLIGHSLGGLLARGVAMRRPDAVARIITLGSPVQGLRVHAAIAAAAQTVGSDPLANGKPVTVTLVGDHTELYKQFAENDSFKRWLTEMMFSATYRAPAL